MCLCSGDVDAGGPPYPRPGPVREAGGGGVHSQERPLLHTTDQREGDTEAERGPGRVRGTQTGETQSEIGTVARL